jgi:hypothetical protein
MQWDTSIHESPPLSTELVEGFEKITRFKLPKDYREIVQRYPNAYPEKSCIKILVGQEDFVANFGVLMTLDPFFEYESVLGALMSLRRSDEFPKYLLPFALGGGGDFLCFSYASATAEPTVVYLFHDLPTSEGIYPVAGSFSELLGLLYSEPDE